MSSLSNNITLTQFCIIFPHNFCVTTTQSWVSWSQTLCQ